MLKYSIITPTLNAERVLDECLDHLIKQNYPRQNYEIIIADGGSTDKTLEIAKKYNAKIVDNPLKTAEAGKLAGLRQALGEYIAFIDSDNILTDPSWLTRMEEPFKDPEIIASEPIRFSCRSTDHPFTRYFAYMGMGDPINLFLGNYDRYCAITNKWTGLTLDLEEKDGYKKVKLEEGYIPTIGANGFIVRREALTPLIDKEYFFDVDVLNTLLQSKGLNHFYIAKVDIGLVHMFSGTFSTMIRKYQRKIRDYIYYTSINARIRPRKKSNNILLELFYPGGFNLVGIVLYLGSCFTVIPLIIQAIIGFVRKPDWVWVLHPVITEITCYVYVSERVKSFFKKSIYNRENWSQ
jgi:glycosyltransferase involved in cell wall biosynthesis